jgi:hypothetical protein
LVLRNIYEPINYFQKEGWEEEVLLGTGKCCVIKGRKTGWEKQI